MTKYTLTDEHRARFPEWRDKWIANALRTGAYTEDDKARCRAAMDGLYRAADLTPPPRGVFCASPISAAIASAIAHGVWWLRRDQARHHALFGRTLTEAEIAASAREAVAVACGMRKAPFPTRMDAATGAATYDATYDATYAATYAATDAATYDATGAATSAVGPATRFLVACLPQWSRARDGGNHWSGWYAYLTFFRHVVQLPLDYSKFEHAEVLAEFGPRFVHADFWIVSEWPDFIRRDAAGRPHCETGPFCGWRDGRALYRWHGTEVPAAWIEDRASLDPATALTWPNIEQRRAAAEIIGWARVLDHVGARVVDTDTDPMIGTLLEADLPESPGTRFLRVKCGTGRDFCIPVPNTLRTALEANARTYRYTGDLAHYRAYAART